MAATGTYAKIIERIFAERYRKGSKFFEFDRDDLFAAAKTLDIKAPKNIGDLIYSFRYRADFPGRIVESCPPGYEWSIRGVGKARYRFELVPELRIEPQVGRYQIKVPEATPEIVATYAQGDEQALLARVRYNRLVDIFTQLTTYSLQNHLRTQVDGVQFEVDELYVGVGKTGAQYILPVEAKVGRDRVGRVQLEQDIAFCRAAFPGLSCRPIAAHAMADDLIAMFELTVEGGEVRIVDERHYRLVPATEITQADLDVMRRGEG